MSRPRSRATRGIVRSRVSSVLTRHRPPGAARRGSTAAVLHRHSVPQLVIRVRAVRDASTNDVVIARLLVAHAVGVAVMLCVARGDVSSTTPTSPTPGTVVDSAGCPVEDEAFCEVATEAANALAAGDDEALLGLSASTRSSATTSPPSTSRNVTSAVLHGYGLSDPHFLVHLVNENAYVDHLGTITGGVDPSFADELGDGTLRIIGVGTCGPDVPGRRTYHLAWTAAHRQADGETERVLGSFEFTFADDWRIALTYVGTLAEWRAEQADPLHEAFCEAGRTPWRT